METQIKAARTLLKEQKRLQSKGKDAASATGRGMRYDPIVIRHALLLYQKGAAAYAAAQKTQRLPSVRRLREYRNWTSHVGVAVLCSSPVLKNATLIHASVFYFTL